MMANDTSIDKNDYITRSFNHAFLNQVKDELFCVGIVGRV